jgi:histidinol-phosphate aminotransferase
LATGGHRAIDDSGKWDESPHDSIEAFVENQGLPQKMSRFWSNVVRTLTPYVPGEQPKVQNLVKLNTNENPYGPSPLAVAAMQHEIGDGLRLYPDPSGDAIRQAVARRHACEGITAAHVFVGNGSDEVLAHAFLALLRHDAPLCFPDVTYSFYPVYCGLYGIAARTIPLDGNFAIDVDDYLDGPCGGIIFPNPNAPTGRLLPLGDIDRLAKARPDAVVVVDEAYIDFAGESIPTAIALVTRRPNILIVQTLSKSRSLAGLRVGFAVGHPDLIEGLDRVKNSFNSYPLGRAEIAGAAAAIDDTAHFDVTRRMVIATRERLASNMKSLGFDVLSSAANFIFVRHPLHDASALASGLRSRGILVRHFRAPRIDQFLRISIGTDEESNRLVGALHELVSVAHPSARAAN